MVFVYIGGFDVFYAFDQIGRTGRFDASKYLKDGVV